MKLKKILPWTFAAIAVALIAMFVIWNVGAYRSVETPSPIKTVSRTQENGITFFDGPGTEYALIFYPGGNVEDAAYAALLQLVASNGIDCFLVRMPMRFALLGRNAANRVLNAYSYDHVYIGGHSLGGVAACMYAADHAAQLDGVILLASYSSTDLSDTDLRVLSIVGSMDGLVSDEKVENGRKLLPNDVRFVVIEGGNHAQYGTYGAQKGDGIAEISPEAQRAETCEAMLAFIVGDAHTEE